MGQPFKYAITALVLFAACVDADEIRIGGKLHRDVYVGQSKQFYYVHFPETGVMEKHSRKRLDVTDLVIDDDAAAREALLAQFEAAKANPPSVEPPEKSTSSAVVDTNAFKMRKWLLELAEFESQLLHWEGLGNTRRKALTDGLEGWARQRMASRSAEIQGKNSQIRNLSSQAATHRTEIANAEAKRAEAIRKAAKESNADQFVNHQNRVSQQRRYQRSEYGQYMSNSVKEYYQAAERAERDVEGRKISVANSAFQAQAGQHVARLNQIQGDVNHQVREGLALRDKAAGEAKRIMGYVDRINGLQLAMGNEYRYKLQAISLAQWEGRVSQKTEVVVIPEGVWRISCTRADQGVPSDFSVTIHDATDDRPFTRITDTDFLGMRMRVFDDPGRYYLKIEQDASAIPYQIVVEQLVER